MPSQTFAVTVPHAKTQFAMGRCACGSGASLTTVGSVLMDANGTFLSQSTGTFTAQTNAALQWLSAGGTQSHSQAKVEIYAGGGRAPGACGGGVPAKPADATTPAEMTEKAVNIALSAASLGRNVYEIKNAIASGDTLAVISQGLDGVKNTLEGVNETVSDEGTKQVLGTLAGIAEIGSGVTGGMSGWKGASGGVDKLAAATNAAATGASGAGGIKYAGGGAPDIEERAVENVKMVAGFCIKSIAGVGFDFKTINKYAVNAAAIVDFTTITWAAFCLLKYEVKAGVQVKYQTSILKVDASKSAKMDAKAFLTFTASGHITYDSLVNVTKTLKVGKATQVDTHFTVKKDSRLDAKLTVDKDVVIKQKLQVKKNFTSDGKITGKAKKSVKKTMDQFAKAALC